MGRNKTNRPTSFLCCLVTPTLTSTTIILSENYWAWALQVGCSCPESPPATLPWTLATCIVLPKLQDANGNKLYGLSEAGLEEDVWHAFACPRTSPTSQLLRKMTLGFPSSELWEEYHSDFPLWLQSCTYHNHAGQDKGSSSCDSDTHAQG